MSQVLDDLSALLKLERIEQGIYRGESQDLGFKALFGGQVMGVALILGVLMQFKMAKLFSI